MTLIDALLGSGRPHRSQLRWTGNEKQQYRAARVRARRRGHWTQRAFTEYGPLNNPTRWRLRCSCGVADKFATEVEQILAERAHIKKAGAK